MTTTTTTKLPLSKSDTLVLSQVFNPEALPSAQNQNQIQRKFQIDPSLPPDRHITSPSLLAELKAREKEAIWLIEEFESSTATEAKEERKEEREEVFAKSHEILTALIEQYPEYASAYNNRAQVLRWFHSSPSSSTPTFLSQTTAILDLQTSMTLTTAPTLSSQAANLLAQAHTSLGAIYHQSKTPSDAESASKHFALGAQYGNEVARAMSIQTNPHAKLCGEIVREAMRKEIEGTT